MLAGPPWPGPWQGAQYTLDQWARLSCSRSRRWHGWMLRAQARLAHALRDCMPRQPPYGWGALTHIGAAGNADRPDLDTICSRTTRALRGDRAGRIRAG